MTRAAVLALTLGLNAANVRAQTPQALSAHDQRARGIFEQLININTTRSSGSTTAASKAMADWLLNAGLPLPQWWSVS